MKKLMFAFFLFCGGVIAVNAQDSTSTENKQYPTQGQASSMDDQDREKINSRDLPDAVKRSLEGQEYRGWLVNAAYKTKGVSSSSSTSSTGSSTGSSSSSSTTTTDDQSSSSQGNRSQGDSTSVSGNGSGAYAQEAFVVELKNGAQTKTVRFDKDGKKLDDPGMKNDQDKK
jgi:hypothetical protein